MISALALGAGLTWAGLGLVVLLMLRTMHPRATPTLIWGGRLWHLRTVALALGVRPRLAAALRKRGSIVPPSQANFLLVKLAEERGFTDFSGCRAAGVPGDRRGAGRGRR
jgi:hypothetical protein